MTEVDHLFLTRAEMSLLVTRLRELPAILRELPDVIARLARMQATGHTISLGSSAKSIPPIYIDAWQAGQSLAWHLLTTVRAICEQRGIGYVPVGWLAPEFIGPPRPGQQRMQADHVATPLELAAWIDRHVISLAMTEHAGEMFAALIDAMEECARHIDLPDEDHIEVDQRRVQAANNKVLTAYQIEKIAAKLGEAGRGLNRDRVRYLVRRGLREADRDGTTCFYRLGDVLAAHQRHVSRARMGGSAA